MFSTLFTHVISTHKSGKVIRLVRTQNGTKSNMRLKVENMDPDGRRKRVKKNRNDGDERMKRKKKRNEAV